MVLNRFVKRVHILDIIEQSPFFEKAKLTFSLSNYFNAIGSRKE